MSEQSHAPRGERQRQVLEVLSQLGGRATLREIVGRYVIESSPSERADFDANPYCWSREYDSIASALSNLKRGRYVTSSAGRWLLAAGPGGLPAGFSRPPSPREVDGSALYERAVQSHNVDLSCLVAAVAIWAPTDPKPERPQELTRRARPGQGEKRGQHIREPHPDTGIEVEVRLDDNSAANRAIKKAAGARQKFVGFEACHIWPKSCYDIRYHTFTANLVLIPRALAGLTDHDKRVEACLKYRAYELFDWYPRGRNRDIGEQWEPPQLPGDYPDHWREPGEFDRDVAA